MESWERWTTCGDQQVAMVESEAGEAFDSYTVHGGNVVRGPRGLIGLSVDELEDEGFSLLWEEPDPEPEPAPETEPHELWTRWGILRIWGVDDRY